MRRLMVLVLILSATAGAAQQAELVVQAGRPVGDLIAVSDDGHYVASVGACGFERCVPEIMIWNRDGRLLRVLRSGLDGFFTRVELSPAGNLLVASGTTRGAGSRPVAGFEVWDLSGDLLWSVGESHFREGVQATFSADGRRIAAVGMDPDGRPVLHVWTTDGTRATSVALPTPESDDPWVTGAPWAPTFSPDGELVYCIQNGDRITVVDLGSGDARLFARTGPITDRLVVDNATGRIAALVAQDAGTTIRPGGWEEPVNDARLLVWDSEGTELVDAAVHRTAGYGPPASGFAATANGGFVIAREQDSYELANGVVFVERRYEVTLLDQSGAVVKRISSGSGSPGIVAVAQTGEIVAVVGDRSVRMWDHAGETPRVISAGTAYREQVAVSPDGTRFVTGPNPAELWSIDGRLLESWTYPPDRVPQRLAFTPTGNILSLNVSGYEVRDQHGRSIEHREFSGYVINDRAATNGRLAFFPMSYEGGLLLDVATGDGIGFSHADQPVVMSPNGSVILTRGERSVSLHSRSGEFVDALSLPDGHIAAVAASNSGRLAWIASVPGGARRGGWSAMRPALQLASVHRDGETVEVDYPFDSLLGAGLVFGPEEQLALFSTEESEIVLFTARGELLRRFVGHRGGVQGVTFVPGGRHMVSISTDGTIRLWNTENGESVSLASQGHEWVAYTDDGFFDASPGGGDLVGITQGSRSYPIEQFALRYNRPDLILARVGVAGPDQIEYLRRQHARRLAAMGQLGAQSTHSQSLLQATVPAAEIVEWNRLGSDRVEITARFTAQAGLATYNVYVNGVPVNVREGVPISGERTDVTVRVPLGSGENRIDVGCIDQLLTESVRDTIVVAGAPALRGDLYFLGFGVSDYQDPRLDLIYPRKDVFDLARLFESMDDTYETVTTHPFTDAACTVDAFRESRRLLEDTQIHDTVVLLLSGHGVHAADPSGTYYFLTHETDLDNLSETAVAFSEIQDLVDGIAARNKLVLLDTCESGAFDEETIGGLLAQVDAGTVRSRTIRGLSVHSTGSGSAPEATDSLSGIDIRGYLHQRDRYLFNDLMRRTGAIVFSSSRGGELSYEPSTYQADGNGFFTGAVIDAIRSPAADADGDGRVSTAELRLPVMEAVSTRSGGLQNPTVDRDNPLIVFTFPLPSDALDAASPQELNAYLRAAATAGNTPLVRELLQRGARVSATRDAPGVSLARSAWEAGNVSTAWVLVEAGAPLPPGMAVSEIAAGNGARVQAALRSGTVIETDGRDRAFWHAVQQDSEEAVRLLLSAGVSLDPAAAPRWSPVVRAQALGFPDLARLITDRQDAAVELVQAIYDGNAAEAARLIEDGAPVNLNVGVTPLIAAADRPNLLRLLIDHGARPWARDRDGKSALFHAAEGGHLVSVALLLDAGADPSVASLLGVTPLLAAHTQRHREVVALLERR